MKKGREHKRYIIMNMAHADYNKTITAFRTIHANMEAENELTVLPNNANTQALVKVAGHVGWLDDEAIRLADGLTSGLMLNIYDYDNIDSVHALLSSEEWRNNRSK